MAFSMHAATFSNAASLQKILGCGERYISTAASSPVLCSSAPTTFDRGPGVCVDINAAISWIAVNASDGAGYEQKRSAA